MGRRIEIVLVPVGDIARATEVSVDRVAFPCGRDAAPQEQRWERLDSFADPDGTPGALQQLLDHSCAGA